MRFVIFPFVPINVSALDVVAKVFVARRVGTYKYPPRATVSVAFMRETIAVVDERLKKPEFPDRYV